MEMRAHDIGNRDSTVEGEPEASDMQCQTDTSGHGSNSCSTDPNPYTPKTLGVNDLAPFRRSFSPESAFSYPPYPTAGFPYSEFPPLKRPRIHNIEDDNLSEVGSSCFFDSPGVTVSPIIKYLHVPHVH